MESLKELIAAPFHKELIAPAVVSCIFGILSALATTTFQLRKRFSLEKKKENDRLCIEYMHPLLVSAQDYLSRIMDLNRRLMNEDEKRQVAGWFQAVTGKIESGKKAFYDWANDEGFFAVSCLYITALYFSYASKVRRRYPFFELSEGNNKDLLYHISDVRISAGGKFGIWEDIQDSLGDYLMEKDTGRIKNYREFCEMLSEPSQAVWFNRMLDFYRDFNIKLEDQLENIELSLQGLIRFLMENLDIRAIEFHISETALAELEKKKIPLTLVSRLHALKGKEYDNEADFFNDLIPCLGQNDTDDYKPSILRCATKKKSGLFKKKKAVWWAR